MDYQTISRNSGAVTGESNRVLRNTYALLALSMVPTVAGALLGTMYAATMLAAGPGMTMILFLVLSFGLMFGIQRTKDSGMGVVLLLAFTFVMGLMLGPLLSYALRFANGGVLIATAAGGTGTIFFVLAGVATTTQRDLSKLGSFLFAGLIVILIASLANMFLHLPILMLAISTAAVLLFSALILFDINRIVRGGETNYVTATLSVYLDIYNVFVYLLQLLMMLSGNDRR